MNKVIILLLLLSFKLQSTITVDNKNANTFVVTVCLKRLCGKSEINFKVKTNGTHDHDGLDERLGCCNKGFVSFKLDGQEEVLVTHRVMKDWNYDFYITSDDISVSESYGPTEGQTLNLNLAPQKIYYFEQQ